MKKIVMPVVYFVLFFGVILLFALGCYFIFFREIGRMAFQKRRPPDR